MPVMILRGSPTDLYHPASICEEVHARLPSSFLADAPWPGDTFAHRTHDQRGYFIDWPLIVPALADFAKAPAPAGADA